MACQITTTSMVPSVTARKHLSGLGCKAGYKRPGTDAALAMAFINVIAEEDLYDHEFVERWCYGFDELAERAKDYPPEKVAEITWIPANQIREAARAIAAADGCALQWGVAIDQTR